MSPFLFFRILFICVLAVLATSCTSSGSGTIDSLFGNFSSAPILTSIPDQIVSQEDLLKIDVNNIKEKSPGDDKDMSYVCFFDNEVDGIVTDAKPCDTILNSTVSFDAVGGVLSWTPHANSLGNYEVRITGKNSDGTYDEIFTVGVRLKFDGIGLFTQITGSSVTVNWTPNASAQGYQVFKLNSLTGQYETLKAVSGGGSSGTTITGLTPNSPYTLRVQAIDALGNFDGNVVSRSFTTTELVKLSMSTSDSTLAAGTPTTITVHAFNANGSPQTIGGLPVTPSIASGNSSGNFSAVTDNNDGSYTFTFTPNIVGTAITIDVSINISFFLNNVVSLNIIPGPASSANSTISISSNTVVSGNLVTATATIRDAFNNPISSGQVVSFVKGGGTSTGTFSAISNQGNGVYSVAYSGVTAGTAQTLSIKVDNNNLIPSTLIQVLPGTPISANSTLTISSSTIASGTAATLTATLKDLNNNPVPSGIMVVFNKSGGTSSGNFDSIVNAGAGVYTTTYSGVNAGTAQLLSVSVDGVPLIPTVNITVIPGPASLANSSLTISSPTVISGAFATVTATLKDVNNNPIDAATVSFTKTGGTSTGTFNTVTNQGNGVYNIRYTGITAGTAQTLAVLVNGVNLGATNSVTVLTGSPSPTQSSIAISSQSVVSGSAVTVTATIKDDNNNPVTSGVAISFSKTGGTSTGDFGTVVNQGAGVYTVTYTGVTAGTAQTINILTDGSGLGPNTTIAVTNAAPQLANSSLTIGAATITSGQTTTVTATIKDLNNNPISSGLTLSFSKTGGTSTGTFGSIVNQGAGVYTVTYTGVTAGTAQDIKVLISSVNLGLNATVTVIPGAPSAAQSTIAVSNSSVISGQSVTVTGTVRDANNNPITSGVAITFSKTGGSSTGTFSAITNQGAGVYTLTYSGVVAGSAQTLGILADGVDLGPTTSVAVTPGAPASGLSTLSITSNIVIAGQSVTLTASIKDANSNPISSGILVSFDKIGGTSFGNYSSVVNQGGGVYTATYTGITAGTAQTVQANVNGAGFGPTQSIQVLVGAPSLAHSSLTVSSGTVASGSSVNITAIIKDSQNNPITSQYAITLDTIGGSSTGTLSSVNNSGTGSFTATYLGSIAGSAQTLRVLADGTPISGLTTTIQVLPGPASAASSTFTIASSNVQSSTSTTLSMNIRDANNNAIASGATVTFTKSAGASDGTLSGVSNAGSGNYTATYTGTTMGAPQTIGLVVNGTAVGLTVSVSVSAGPPTHFAVTTPVLANPSIDCNGPYTLTMKDVNENTTSALTPVNLTLSSNPVGSDVDTMFTDASCSNTVAGFTIPALTSSLSFYYKAYTPTSFVLTLTPSTSITAANINISNYAVLSWIGASAKFTMNGTGAGTVIDDANGGFWQPADVTVSGNYMYAVDNTANRILRYNISTNTFAGWIGYIGSVEGMTGADPDNTCASPTLGALTSSWCLGGRVNPTATTLMNALRSIASDSTYIYVSSYSNHRILRFKQSDGSFQGWIGKINTTAATSPVACVNAGTAVSTPTWCTGGTSTSGNADGQFNAPTSLLVHSGKLYVAEYSNHRIQKIDLATGVSEGWVGQAATTPPASGQLVTCSPLPTAGVKTPGWCLGGTPQVSRRNQGNLTTNPSEVAPPDEGFYNPAGVTTDGNYLYVGDGNNYRVSRLNLSTGAFAGWVGYVYRSTATSPTTPSQTGGTYTTTWTSGGVTEARSSNGFGQINNVVFDSSSNNIYVTDNQHRVIRIRSSDGGDLRWIGRAGTSPTGGYTGCSSTPVSGTTPGWCVNGSGGRYGNTSGTFYNPVGLAVTATKLFVADSSNFRIQRFDLVNGTFDGWIGAGNIPATKWSRTYTSSAASARGGIDDYSFGDMAGTFAGITMNSSHIFVSDVGWNRIKKFNRTDGSFIGYIGQILNNGGFYPTGPDACVGYTSGMTPDWCTGGGRTTSGSGIHGYNNPYSVTSDNTYVYIANYSNNRIDRVRSSDALYLGWLGQVSTTPTDGDPACLSTNSPNPTPDWCIGGLASAGTTNGKFSAPRVVYYDSGQSVIYAIDNTSRIMKIDPANGNFLGVIGGVTAGTGCTVTNNVAAGWCTDATGNSGTSRYGGMNAASGLATNTSYIFVADTSNNRILRFDKTSGAPVGFISKMTNATNLNTTATGGACNGVTAGYPRITPGWCWTTTLGSTMNNVAGSEEGAFNNPRGVWADATYVYVTDSLNNRISRITISSGASAGWKGMIASTAGMTDADCIAAGVGGITPKWCTGGTSGPGRQLGAFDYPSGIFGDGNYLYIHDGRNNRIVTIPK